MDRLKGGILGVMFDRDAYLHSSMDRLKDTVSLRKFSSLCDLHSSMDRLKAITIPIQNNCFFIYIPVWID